jgi:post-segregation antitoxin (ccd killing protein)
MSRINVYLPDDLAAAARHAGLNVSALTQAAIRTTLAQKSTDDWLNTLHPVPPHRATHEDVIVALDVVRDEASTRHG